MEKKRPEMKLTQCLSGQMKPQSLGLVAVGACFLLPCVFLAVLNPNLDKLSILNLQPLMRGSYHIQAKEDISSPYLSGIEVEILPHALKEGGEENQSSSPFTEDNVSFHLQSKETQSEKNKLDTVNFASVANPLCDLSQGRSDTCSLHGDIRVLGRTSSIIIASSIHSPEENTTWKIRPYARKWEPPLMKYIKELTLVTTTSNLQEAPQCTINHDAPAVIFSTGGFLGNLFHDFTDVLVPLFITSRQYQGEVHFLVTDFNVRWITKYWPILNKLSQYDIINLDRDKEVHCFPQAQLGLFSHKELGMDPSQTPNGYSMADFRELLRSSFSFQRSSITTSTSNKRPRLVIVLRKGSRSLVNRRAVVSMARSLGFKVVAAWPEGTRNLTRFSRIVNSCDVMMGVHGAGLANMVFLPAGAAVVQIVPWGGLKWACRHDFGDPAPEMGLKYLEYEIREEESTLIEQYPRDHPVFTDPLSIHKQGWNALWSVFLDKQKVRLNVQRFKNVLLEALQAIH